MKFTRPPLPAPLHPPRRPYRERVRGFPPGCANFHLNEGSSLPRGLRVDPESGEVVGVPEEPTAALHTFDVVARGPDGRREEASVSIEVADDEDARSDTTDPDPLPASSGGVPASASLASLASVMSLQDKDVRGLFFSDIVIADRRALVRSKDPRVAGCEARHFSCVNPELWPPGWAVDPYTGVVSGPASSVITAPLLLEVQAEASDGFDLRGHLRVRLKAPIVTYKPIRQPVHKPVSARPVVGARDVRFSLAPNSKPLPPGLRMDEAGFIRGVCKESVRTVLTVRGVGGDGVEHFADVEVHILPEKPRIKYKDYKGVAGRELQLLPVVAGGRPDEYRLDAKSKPLPAGIVLDRHNGSIIGTPAQECNCTVAIRAVNAAGVSDEARIKFQIEKRRPVFRYEPGAVSLCVGRPCEIIPEAIATTPPFRVSPALPRGLLLDPTTAVISGQPDVDVPAPMDFTVSDSGTPMKARLRLSTWRAPTVVYPAIEGRVGTEIMCEPDVRSGRVQSYSLARGSLPPGLVLDHTTGVVRGVPEARTPRRVVHLIIRAQCAGVRRCLLLPRH